MYHPLLIFERYTGCLLAALYSLASSTISLAHYAHCLYRMGGQGGSSIPSNIEVWNFLTTTVYNRLEGYLAGFRVWAEVFLVRVEVEAQPV